MVKTHQKLKHIWMSFAQTKLYLIQLEENGKLYVIVKRAVKICFMSLYACKIQIVLLKLDDWANLAHF